MKKIKIASVIILFCTITLQAQTSERVFQSLDADTVLQRLFDVSSINAKGQAVWKPNFFENMNYPVSKDGNCYSEMDTILYFTDRFGIQNALIVFKTLLVEDGRIVACKTCGPALGNALFSKSTKSSWELSWFNKRIFYNAFTTIGNLNLLKINNSGLNTLTFTTEESRETFSHRTIQYYNIFSGKSLFSSFIFLSDKHDADKSKHFGYEVTINIIPTSDWYILEASYKGTDKDHKANRIYPVGGKRRFYYDVGASVFVNKQCN